MASVTLTLQHNKINKSGEAPIYIRMAAGQTRKYKSTGIWIKPIHWNEDAQSVRKSIGEQNRDEINARLQEIKARAMIQLADLQRRGRSVTATKLKKSVSYMLTSVSPDQQYNLLHIGRRVNGRIREQSYNYYKKRRTILNKLEEYTGGQGVHLDDINSDWINEFYYWLLDDKKLAKNTARKAVKVLGNFFSEAITLELTEQRNPFMYVRYPSEKTEKQRLNDTEIKQLKNAELEKESWPWHARNYWLAQMYMAGMRISDLCRLQKSDWADGRIEYQMKKTTTWKSVLVTPPLQEILSYYTARDPDNPNMFPLLNKPASQYKTDLEISREIGSINAHVNKNLKIVQRKAKIKKTLATHIARHSFANLARKAGWNVYDISKALGHTSIRVTENYLDSFDTDGMDQGMEKLFG